MRTRPGFDLTPVLDLLDALSAGTPTNPFLPDPGAVASTGARSLGDFPALWQFLDEYRRDDSSGGAGVTVPVPVQRQQGQQQKQQLTPPPSPVLPAQPQPQSRRRRRRRGTPVTVKVTPTATTTVTPDSPIIADYSTSTDFTDFTDTTEELPHTPSPIPALTRRFTPPLTRSDRKSLLIQKLLLFFPLDAPTLLNPYHPQPPRSQPIHVFVDNSNIHIGFLTHRRLRQPTSSSSTRRSPKMSFSALALLLERGRRTAKRVLVGSLPITSVISEAASLGYETSLLTRVHKPRPFPSSSSSSSASSSEESSRRTRLRQVEQGVDEILHLKILESILDYAPSTIVLASGDAAKGEYSPGFMKVVERALERGWCVELVSWERGLGGGYREGMFRGGWGGRFRVVGLDGFVDGLVEE